MDTDTNTKRANAGPTGNDSGQADFKDKVKDAAGEVVGETKQTVKETGERLAGEAKERGKGLAAKAGATVDQGKSEIAAQVGSIASAFREAGTRLREEEQGSVGHYAERLGEQVQQVADYLQDKDARAIVRDVEGYARRQPAVFLGTALALGMVAARFLKSSQPSGPR